MKPLLIAACFLVLTGCSLTALYVTNYVERVRAGVLPQHESRTVGKAFEGAFQNAKWSSLATPDGQTVVQFDGTTTADTLRQAGIGYLPFYFLREKCLDSLNLRSKYAQLMQADNQIHQRYRDATSNMPRLRPYGGARAPQILQAPQEWEERRRAAYEAENKELAERNDLINAYDRQLFECGRTMPIPVTFQFKLSEDKKTFTLYDSDAIFGGLDAALEFVYH